MSFELIVQPSAKRDIAESDAYYAQYGKADAFIAALDDVFMQIADRPLMYPVIYADVRRALMRRFPYSVFFVVESGRVVVLASITSVETLPQVHGADVVTACWLLLAHGTVAAT